MINLDSPNSVIIWGFKHPERYHTHSHIHEGFFRAAKHLWGDRAYWLDDKDDLSKVDFRDSLIITEHEAAKRGMPIEESSFFVIHGMNNDKVLVDKMSHITKKLSWNVFHDYSHGNTFRNCTNSVELADYSEFLKGLKPGPPKDSEVDANRVYISEDFYYYPNERNMDFRWATDLLPHEIEENKKSVRIWNPDSKVIHYVGSLWFCNEKEISAFQRVCNDNQIEFRPVGAGQRGVVSIEENIRLVRESHFSPAIVGTHHCVEGYLCCRILKNVSYGMAGITNSKRVNDIFDGKLIFNEDPYQLFHDARNQLPNWTVERVQELMDIVKNRHTYVQRFESILKTAKLVMEAE